MIHRTLVVGRVALYAEVDRLDAEGWKLVQVEPAGRWVDHFPCGLPPADDTAWWVWARKEPPK